MLQCGLDCYRTTSLTAIVCFDATCDQAAATRALPGEACLRPHGREASRMSTEICAAADRFRVAGAFKDKARWNGMPLTLGAQERRVRGTVLQTFGLSHGWGKNTSPPGRTRRVHGKLQIRLDQALSWMHRWRTLQTTIQAQLKPSIQIIVPLSQSPSQVSVTGIMTPLCMILPPTAPS